MMKSKLILFFFLLCSLSYGQVDDNIFSRLQAISNSDIDFFNIDGIEITSHKIYGDFTPKNISKSFKQFKIKKNELNGGDSLLGIQNYYVFKTQEKPKGIHHNTSYYFIKSSNKSIIGFTFASINKANHEFERKFIKLVVNNQIPDSVYNNLPLDSIDFAGRKIPLGGSCHWMGVNNVQCRYYGQMNWSVHKDLEDARKTVNNQFQLVTSQKSGKVVVDTIVNILFEGTETTARKIIYDFTGLRSALLGMSGSKTLTIYFVAAAVRDNYVSCVMSFWNNDQINPSGLPPLLELVMKLQ